MCFQKTMMTVPSCVANREWLPNLSRPDPSGCGEVRRRVAAGFTLIELLTVIAIIGILAGIMIPVVASVRDSARAAKCTSNVRQTGYLVLTMMEDNDFRLETQRDGGGTGRMWTQLLSSQGYMRSLDEREILYCPSVDLPAGYDTGAWHWKTYGLFMIPNFPEEGVGANAQAGGGFGQANVNVFVLNGYSVRDPSRLPLLGDSIRLSDHAQVFRIRDRDGNHSEGVRLVHGDRANLFFMDGHVEAADRLRLANLGMRAGYSHDGRLVTFD